MADERDRAVALPQPLRGEHLARPAAGAHGVTVRVVLGGCRVLEDEFVGDHLQVPEAGLLQDRADVEREPVGREHQRQASLLGPSDERREARRELRTRDGERQHLLARPSQHRDLVVACLPEPQLTAIHGLVEALPARLAEHVQEHLGYILQTGGAVEIHQQCLHREHRGSLMAAHRL